MSASFLLGSRFLKPCHQRRRWRLCVLLESFRLPIVVRSVEDTAAPRLAALRMGLVVVLCRDWRWSSPSGSAWVPARQFSTAPLWMCDAGRVERRVVHWAAGTCVALPAHRVSHDPIAVPPGK